jgi:Uma2 family endonuclease
MASTTLLTVEEYLKTHYEWEPEYVRGELIERAMPNKIHARLVALLTRRLPDALYCYVEFRMRLPESVFRIPDLAAFRDEPDDFPAAPPLVTVEVTSPDDPLSEILRKCEEYRAWGVPNIWVIESEVRKFYVYTAGLSEVDRFDLAEFGFSVSAESLFAEATAR